MQILGPSPKGMKIWLGIKCLFSAENLSGSNRSGSGKKSGSIFSPIIDIFMTVSFSSLTSVPGRVQFFKVHRFSTATAGCNLWLSVTESNHIYYGGYVQVESMALTYAL